MTERAECTCGYGLSSVADCPVHDGPAREYSEYLDAAREAYREDRARSRRRGEREATDIVKSALFTAFESGWFDNQGDLGDGWEECLPYLMDTYEVKALLARLCAHSPDQP